VDQFDDEELLELVQLEVQELLESYNFPGEDILFISGSALLTLKTIEDAPKDRDTDKGVDLFDKIMDSVDEYIPTPERKTENPSLMAIENVFSATGRGTGATGRIERGFVAGGDAVELRGLEKTRGTTVNWY
jgi:elongation factor Tu